VYFNCISTLFPPGLSICQLNKQINVYNVVKKSTLMQGQRRKLSDDFEEGVLRKILNGEFNKIKK